MRGHAPGERTAGEAEAFEASFHPAARPVRFEATDLWHDGQDGVSVHVDLWDSYLEPA